MNAIHPPASLQQSQKHSHSLQLANHTRLAHHYIVCFIRIFVPRIPSKYHTATPKHWNDTWKGC